MRDVPAHWIKENAKANIPSRLVVIDTIPLSRALKEGEQQTWRCGVASFTHWTSKGNIIQEFRAYTDPGLMWKDIGEFTRKKRRTIVYSHNLPYDLRISNGLVHLPRLVFKLESIRVASQGSWSRWTRSGATLTLCDSASVFPVTLATLGVLAELPKLDQPSSEDLDGWGDYATRNVDILTRLLTQYWAWLKTGVAGNWQLTGAGQSWAHWRHSHYTDKVLVHSDLTALAAEREAMWTGRAENWSWGKDTDAPVYEWDWENSYPRIARDCDLPVQLVGHANAASVRDLITLAERYIILAEVDITTEHPVVPTRHDGRILWPVGTFRTTLWWPEIDAVLSTGGTVSPRRVWLYRGAPALRQWGDWIISQIHDKCDTAYKWAPIVLKHWSRTLIGRFATQYQDWEHFGTDLESKVLIGDFHDCATGETTQFMQVGTDLHVMTGMSESDDSCPQMTSYIMSVARRRLWDAGQLVGWSNVLYMDTDSLVVNLAGHALLRRATSSGQLDGLRLKNRHRGYEIFGPRSAIIGSKAVFAGMPRGAHRTSEDTWMGEVWTQLERSLTIGEHDRVTIRPRRFTVRYNEHRRSRLPDGRTAPHELVAGALVDPRATHPADAGTALQDQLRAQLGAKRVGTPRVDSHAG